MTARFVKVPTQGRVPPEVGEWERLSADAAYFLSATFFRLSGRLLKLKSIELLAAYRDGRMVAALPFEERGRELRALISDHSPRYDLVGDSGALDSLWRALRSRSGWDVIAFDEVPGNSPLVTQLPALARADGYHFAIREGTRSPYFALDGFSERLSSKFRGNLRRRRAKLGGTTLERLTRFDRSALNDAFRLEAMAWKGDAGTAIVSDPALRKFYTSLARYLGRRGLLQLVFLRLTETGKRIAFHYAVDDGKTYYVHKPGYDPEYSSSGPGHLLIDAIASDAKARHVGIFDFMGMDQSWKMEWTDRVLEHKNIVIYRPSARGTTRYLVREVLRPRAAKIVRWLRAWKAPSR